MVSMGHFIDLTVFGKYSSHIGPDYSLGVAVQTSACHMGDPSSIPDHDADAC